MKLRNKKTGDIGELQITEKHCGVAVGNGTASCGIEIYSSLAELNADWEDYEEPKEQYYIDCDGRIFDNHTTDYIKGKMQEIGNYFETKEEAEKAVEKLKAWKRLKDKGFEFEGIAGLTNEIYFKSNEPFNHIMVDEYTADQTEKEYIDDLMLLFGGKE